MTPLRLDQFLSDKGFYPSRSRARAAIEAGLVRVNGIVVTKPSHSVTDIDDIAADGDVHAFVSRGGVKLEAALRTMDVDPAGKTCLDLGASTGGFTDVLLRAGAAKVYAVDVGRDQLAEKLRGDNRVINLEKTHAKDLTEGLVPDPIAVIVCDVSFISLKKALPPALALAAPDARLIALIKPQFEVGQDGLGKGGIVKDGLAGPVAHEIKAWIDSLEGWRTDHLIDSPILGGNGNKEFLIGAVKSV